ncbi:3-oxoacyl-reductase [Macrophomina phaseolina]|uniref:3-oxoacyl-reductase n=1 Tax=Macrophomina phaseolina TaxID=35725 RepID=A0ABQ8GKV4_9PEZI|nr:3-oxoacyl-reductase [Macrophomina phaseolina]
MFLTAQGSKYILRVWLSEWQSARQVAIVSGSPSGIGATIARELSRRGVHVRSLEGSADLSTMEGPKKLAGAAAEASGGRIDILVNNAGRSALCSITSSDAEIARTWDTVVNLNGRGTMLLTRAVLPFLTSPGSRIVNIGSSTSRGPEPDMTAYAGTKGMMESLTRCWAKESPRQYGCTVNTVAPGPVATEALLSAPPEFASFLRKKFERVPVAPRLARPEETAWAVAMLCEEGAGWLNGLYIPVAGG